MDISQCTVVVADADPKGAGEARAALLAADFECVECPQPAALPALLKARPGYHDAIVLGLEVAPEAAIEVLETLKADPALRGIPVVMSGGATGADTISAGIRAGAHHFVARPLAPELLLSVLRAATEKRRAHIDLQRELERTRESLVLLHHAAFEFRTLEDARMLASFLANVAPDPARVVTGLWELMLNAVEHGNLGISYEEKTALLASGSWATEIARRLQAPPYCDRFARVDVCSDDDAVRYRIVDQGAGFLPQSFLDFDVQRLTHTHGRGIAMARRVSFDELRYHARGNDVEAIIRREPAPGLRQARDRGDESLSPPTAASGEPVVALSGRRSRGD